MFKFSSNSLILKDNGMPWKLPSKYPNIARCWMTHYLFTKYSLAKREMLLVASESLVGAQRKQLQLTADDFQRLNARNDQLVKV